MAKLALKVVLDIEWPNGMEDDENLGPEGNPRPTGFEIEIEKIVRDGCIERAFDYIAVDFPAQSGGSYIWKIYDLVAQ